MEFKDIDCPWCGGMGVHERECRVGGDRSFKNYGRCRGVRRKMEYSSTSTISLRRMNASSADDRIVGICWLQADAALVAMVGLHGDIYKKNKADVQNAGREEYHVQVWKMCAQDDRFCPKEASR